MYDWYIAFIYIYLYIHMYLHMCIYVYVYVYINIIYNEIYKLTAMIICVSEKWVYLQSGFPLSFGTTASNLGCSPALGAFPHVVGKKLAVAKFVICGYGSKLDDQTKQTVSSKICGRTGL